MGEVLGESARQLPPVLDPDYQTDSPIMAVHRLWLEQPQVLAYRLQDFINGRHALCDPYLKDNGHWVLDVANNWFLRIENSEVRISYRYGQRKEFWAALKLVIEALLK
jgi:hypothetical protein